MMSGNRHRWGKPIALAAGANPEEYSPLTFAETGHFRSLNCSVYSTCLDYSCSQAWQSFTCIYCPHHAKGGIDPQTFVSSLAREDHEDPI